MQHAEPLRVGRKTYYVTGMARTSAPLSVKLTPQQEEALRALAAKRGVNVSTALRDLLAQASPDFRAAPAPRRHVPARPTHLEVLDLDGRSVVVTREEADRLHALKREHGLGGIGARIAEPQHRAAAERAKSTYQTRYGRPAPSAGTRPPASPGTKPPPSPGTKPAPVRRESEREELERLRAEAYAQLEDFERADAAKIKDPVARARFVVARLARRAKR